YYPQSLWIAGSQAGKQCGLAAHRLQPLHSRIGPIARDSYGGHGYRQQFGDLHTDQRCSHCAKGTAQGRYLATGQNTHTQTLHGSP
ncbi:hypothetical protein LPJ71_007765, partial [Coemansia sp. S17]